jgi:hypothetical protein
MSWRFEQKRPATPAFYSLYMKVSIWKTTNNSTRAMDKEQIQILSSLKCHLILQGLLESLLLALLVLAVVNIVRKLIGGNKLSHRDILLFALCALIIPLVSIPIFSGTFISMMRPFFKDGNTFHFPFPVKLDLAYNRACSNSCICGPFLLLFLLFTSAVIWALFTQHTRTRFAAVIAVLVIFAGFPPAAIAITGIIAKAQEISLLMSYCRY